MSENVSVCRMCGAEESVEIFPVREMMFGSGEEFLYEVCKSCHSLQIKDIPLDLGRHYPDEYSGWTEVHKKRFRSKIRSFIVRNALRMYFMNSPFLREIIPAPERGDLLGLAAARPNKTDKILDVGCGKDAFFLKCLSEIGFSDLTGADPFANKDETLFGRIRLLKKTLREVNETFDIITLNHSLEHTSDPQSELVEVFEKLNPRGRAVVRLPTPSSKAYQEYGAEWVQLDAPRHLNIPSRKAMPKMIERAGLKILTSFDDSGALQFYGSELHKRGIALTSPNARQGFTTFEMNKFLQKAKELNRQNNGDQVCYVLSK